MARAKKVSVSTNDSQYLDLSSQGLTKVQIAVRLGVLCQDLLSSLSPGVAEKGKELCQVFHENLMDSMIKGENKASTKEMELQAWRLKTLFKDDWSDKQTEKNISPYAGLSDSELETYVKTILHRHRATFQALFEAGD